ncbi:hypothetical protein, variant, partial [Phytophthora nicotianae]
KCCQHARAAKISRISADDFNRLYDRLVVRRTSKNKRARRQVTTVVSVNSAEDAKALQQASEAARLEKTRHQEQLECDAKIASTVKRLRFARNLRGLARLTHCNPHQLAFQLVDATEEEQRQILLVVK